MEGRCLAPKKPVDKLVDVVIIMLILKRIAKVEIVQFVKPKDLRIDILEKVVKLFCFRFTRRLTRS